MAKKSGPDKAAKPRPKRKTLTAQAPRRLKIPPRLPSAWRLTKTAAATLWHNKRLFGGITLIYGVLNLILVQGFASTGDINSLKSQVNHVASGQLSSVGSGLGVFALLLGGSGNGSSQTAGAYQLFLGLIASLAMIWALRQVLAGARPRIRDAYYRGIYPLVPFILVLLVIGLELLPLLVGSGLYTLVMTNGIAVGAIEKLLWLLFFIASGLWTLYMLGASLVALYIVTLPDMTPRRALRSARELVRGRRWTILRKLLWLPALLLIVAAVIMVPIIAWITPLAGWVFFILTMLALLAVHAYMYTLYRELLNE